MAGGRLIAELAADGDPEAIDFPRALEGEMDFSFSGLKTSVLHYVRSLSPASACAATRPYCRQLPRSRGRCLSRQDPVGCRSSRSCGPYVSRAALPPISACASACASPVEHRGLSFHCPAYDLCTDNAAMVGAVGAFYLSRGVCDSLDVDAAPRLSWRV